MKNLLYVFIGACVLLFAIGLFYDGEGGGGGKFPKVYSYQYDIAKVTITLYEDGTAQRVTTIGNSPSLIFRTSWVYYHSTGQYEIEAEGGGSNVIKDGVWYETPSDARAKRNGTKLTLRE